MKTTSISVAVLVLLCSAACAKPETGGEITKQDARDLLETARQRWASRTSEMSGYELELSVRCYCNFVGHYRLRVRPGQENEVTDFDSGSVVTEELASRIRKYDVEGLFREVQDGIASGYDEASAIYDYSYGYPIAIQIDGNRKMFDDELQIHAELKTYPASS